MEEPQKVAEEPVAGARGDGVKTKNGCENVILGQNLPSRGVVNNYFSENSSDLGHYFLPSSPKKVRLHSDWKPMTSAYNDLRSEINTAAENSYQIAITDSS